MTPLMLATQHLTAFLGFSVSLLSLWIHYVEVLLHVGQLQVEDCRDQFLKQSQGQIFTKY